MMLLQTAVDAASHPLSGTIAEWVWLLPVLPLAGFVVNGLLSLNSARFGPKDPNTPAHHPHSEAAADAAAISHAEQAGAVGDDHHAVKRHRWATVTSIVGPGVLILAFGLALGIWQAMVAGHPDAPFVQRYFSWMPVGDLQIDAAFQLDQLSMVMVLVITGVGALIHIFSVGYMREDPGYPRFFAYLNLFVFFMLVLVLGANYPVLFVGWEGVGLCSYLLIGFWFNDKANADAGKKAFIVNRIGDFGLLVAMFLLFANIGVLDFVGVNAKAVELGAGSALVTAICLFMFLGCTGKSAQIPLYIWLPDAMAGPTPVSALIHAATMVTAGVYLIARSAALFSLSPVASLTVAIVGALTAIFAATIGLKQWDIKKVLAYSTISQLGYMFIGVGVGAYVSGMFHLVTHAFFKALLFLGSGSVIHAMHAAYHSTHSHEDAQDMRNMGGLRRYLPVTCALMWIATLAISGIPPLSGFFSKDEILGAVFAR
ncbi:MAG: NADH-quinone oxidoreductase subunit L, partial [Gemmatimonadaceae bacterium]